MKTARTGRSPTTPAQEQPANIPRGMRDLAALATLPSIWVDCDLRRSVQNLTDVLRAGLKASTVCVRVELPDGDRFDAASSEGLSNGNGHARGAELLDAVPADGTELVEIPRFNGSGPLNALPQPIFFDGRQIGYFVACFRDDVLPSASDRLLLHVAASQVMLLLQRQKDQEERFARKLAEERLRQAEHHYQQLVQVMPAAVYTCDAGGRITFFNRRAAELWGREPHLGDCDQKFCGAFRLWRPDGSRMLHADTPMAAALRDGVRTRNGDVVIERPDGSRACVSVNIDPLYDANGKCCGAINVFQDVTPLKTAEDELRRKNSQLAAFLETAAVGLHRVGPDGIIQWANAAELKMLGYLPEEYIGHHIAEFHADEPVIDDILKRLACGESICDREARLRCRDGSIKHVLIDSSALWEDGQFIHTQCFTRDITDRKRAEEALRQSEERLRNIFNQTTAGIAQVDIEGRFVLVNQRFCEITGYSANELRTKTCADITHPDDQVCNRAMFENALREQKPYAIEKRYVRPDGSHVWVRNNVSRITEADGGVRHMLAVSVDITAQKQAEEALRQSESHLREILEALPAAVYRTDADGHITGFNQAAVQFSGRVPELGTDSWCVSWKLYWPDGTPMRHDECPMAIALKEGRPIRECEAIAERPDGSRVHFTPYPTPLRDADGKLVGAVNMLVDITERKKAELLLARRASEQAALYEFTDKLHRAASMADIYESALDAILDALGCQRASILLFDASGVMRFVGWRGLSEAYRKAVEGHSPWNREAKDPQPVCVDDVEQAEISDALKNVVKNEGIRGLAFMPLVANGQLLGKFMAYYDAPHAFTSDELDLGFTIARQLAFAIERKRAEEALSESEKAEQARRVELETLMEAVPAVVWVAHDPECRRITGNRFGYDYLRVPEGGNLSKTAPAEERPQHFEVFKNGQRVAGEELPIQKVARTGQPIRGEEVEHRFTDGTSKWLYGNVVPLRDPNERLRGVLATFVDITQRKKAEQRLAVQYFVTRVLVEAQSIEAAASGILQTICQSAEWDLSILWRMDAQQTELGFVESFHKSSGTESGFVAESRKRTFRKGVGLPGQVWAERRPLWWPELAESTNFPRAPFAAKDRLRTGAAFPIRIGEEILGVIEFFSHERREPDKDFLEMLDAVGSQIGQFIERTQAGEALRKRGERLQLLSETLGQLLSARDPDSIVRELFPKVAAHLGVNTYFNFMVENDGKSLRLHSCAGIPEETARTIQRLEFGQAICGTVAQTRQPIHATDIQHSDYDKAALVRDFGIQCYACNPLMVGERLLGTLSFASRTRTAFDDEEIQFLQIISQYTAVALDRLQAAESLERVVTERTADLREAIAQMEEFSYTVSHDLRAPLRAMQGYADALQEEFTSALPAQARHYLNRISTNALRLDQMVKDVLTFSRLARTDLEVKPVQTDRLVRQMIEQYPGLQPPDAQIEVEVLPDVLAHEPSLTQAISNLLNNAVKFVHPGVKPRVRVWGEQSNGHVRLWIQDNGIGVDPKYQHRLFKMFERVHPELKYEGTGVGLAIVRKATERMGGRAGMESDGANGSRFWIELRGVERGT